MAPALAAALIPAAGQLALSGYQAYKGNQLSKADRPEMQIPQEVLDALKNSKTQASQTRLPGQDILEAKITGQASSAMSNLAETSNSSSSLLSTANKLYGNAMDKLSGVEVQAAQRYDQNQGTYREMLNRVGEWQNKAFDFNQVQPYERQMAAASAMKNAAINNAFGALNSGASGATSYYLNQNGGAGVQGGAMTQQQQQQLMLMANNGMEYSMAPGNISGRSYLQNRSPYTKRTE